MPSAPPNSGKYRNTPTTTKFTPIVAIARKSSRTRIAIAPMRAPKSPAAIVAATSAGQNGQPWDTVRIAVAYAPTPKNAACPSEICPAMPVIVFRPSVSTA